MSVMPRVRNLVGGGLALAGALVCSLALAQPGQPVPASAAASASAPLVLVVSEGTSGGLDHAQVIAKYQDLANVVGLAVRSKVSVVFAREFATLENGMKAGKFDFVMARPSDYPARGMRDNGYRYVANATPPGQCLIVVPKDSPLQKLSDAKGKRFVMPEQVSYMARFCRAELRDQGILLAGQEVKYVREQAAVSFYIHNKLADVGGLASYSGARQKAGARRPARAARQRAAAVFPAGGAQPFRWRADQGHPAGAARPGQQARGCGNPQAYRHQGISGQWRAGHAPIARLAGKIRSIS